MYNISNRFRQEIENDNANLANRLVIRLKDGTTITVENDQIWEGGISYEDATSDSNEFQIGSAIANKLKVALNNVYGDFDSVDFDGAEVAAYVGIVVSGVGSEYYRRGTYIVTSSSGYNTFTVNLECLDFISKFDRPYAEVNTTYPATLQTIMQNICTYCGVVLSSATFFNRNYVVDDRPNDEALTCRQMLAFVAQLACSYARCDAYGRLELRWYDLSDSEPDHVFTSLHNVTVELEPVLITGLKVIEEFPETEQQKKQEYLYGVEGYVLEISGNDLIQHGKAQTVAETIGARLLTGVPFHIVTASIPTDPSVEVGDTAMVTDQKGNSVYFPVTDMIYAPGQGMQISCNAKTAARNSSSRYSELTRALVKAKETSAAQISSYDLAVQQLTELMSEAFGIFKTEQEQPDGSVIYVLHNKPTLEESATQWKMTANGMAVSTDYGQTWNAGIDSQGNAVVNVLNAIGVNADWINAGRIAITDPFGETVFIADVDTGSVYVSGDRVFIGDTSATDAISQLSNALTVTLSNEMQGIPVDSDGDYSVFPEVETSIRAIYGGVDVTNQAQLTYQVFNITGNLRQEQDGHYVYTVTALSGDSGYVSLTMKYNPGTGAVQNSRRFNLYKVYAGEPGPAGQGIPARIYFIEPDSNVIKLGQDNVFKPSTLTFKAYYRDGNEVTMHPYTGLFRVETTTDGITWETVEYPVENKTQTTYTPTDPNLAGVRCTLYSTAEFDRTFYGLSAGDLVSFIADDDGSMFFVDEDDIIIEGGNVLDIQSTAVVVDVSALSQEQVFNILTNNGETQGLYYFNRKVYLNASYIQSGIFRVRKNGRDTFYADADTGTVKIVADEFSLSNGDTIDSIATSKATAAVSGQTQLDIFNKLTNNRQNQGIYLSNGNCYVNATYITSGYIDAARIKANSIAVSKLTGTITNGAWKIDLDNGELTIGNISANNITTGTLSADRISNHSVDAGKLKGTVSSTTGNWGIDFTTGVFTIGSISANNVTSGTMSASRISGGTLTLGGSNNTNGTLIVKDASGTQVGKWDNTGITIDKGSISADAITSGTINAARIGAGSITVSKLGDGSVTADKLGGGSVTSAKIGTGAVTSTKITDSAVTTDKLSANAVTAAKISANAITSDKISASAITSEKIATDAITANKISAGAITVGKISDGAVTSAKIGAGAVTETKITDRP